MRERRGQEDVTRGRDLESADPQRRPVRRNHPAHDRLRRAKTDSHHARYRRTGISDPQALSLIMIRDYDEPRVGRYALETFDDRFRIEISQDGRANLVLRGTAPREICGNTDRTNFQGNGYCLGETCGCGSSCGFGAPASAVASPPFNHSDMSAFPDHAALEDCTEHAIQCNGLKSINRNRRAQ